MVKRATSVAANDVPRFHQRNDVEALQDDESADQIRLDSPDLSLGAHNSLRRLQHKRNQSHVHSHVHASVDAAHRSSTPSGRVSHAKFTSATMAASKLWAAKAISRRHKRSSLGGYDSVDNSSTGTSLAIVGYSADPSQKENWEDDFELDAPDNTPSNGPRFRWGVGTLDIKSPSGLGALAAANVTVSAHRDYDDELKLSSSDEEDDAKDGFTANADKVQTTRRSVDTDVKLQAWFDQEDADDGVVISDDDNGDNFSAHASSSEEDWDEEIAADEQGDVSNAPGDSTSSSRQAQYSTLLRSFLRNESTPVGLGGDFVPKHAQLLHILQEDSSPTVQIVIYPKPSVLYSLTTEDKRTCFREDVHEKWLEHLGVKFIRGYSLQGRAPVIRSNNDSISLSYSQNDNQSPLEALEIWLQDCLDRVHSFYRSRTCWNIDKCWEVVCSTMSELDAGQITIPTTPIIVPENEAIERNAYQLLYLILYSAAKTNAKGNPDKFAGFVSTAIRLFPRYQGQLEVLLVSTLAHNDASRANRVLRNLIVLYRTYELAQHSVEVEVAAEVLANLHLYLNNYSPLNTAVLGAEASWDTEDDEELVWLDHALNELEPSKELLGKMIDEHFEFESLLWQLCGQPRLRMERLQDLYKRLPSISFLRAKCAYVMGHFYLHAHHDTALAEKLLFECVFLLDSIPTHLKSVVPLVSELGTNALIAYGDILLSNGKYRYAIRALESAAECRRLRLMDDDLHSLDRRLCDVCTEHKDWARSLKYHQKILKTSRVQENIAELVYVSQQMSKIHAELGDFAAAESDLLSAIGFINSLITGVSIDAPVAKSLRSRSSASSDKGPTLSADGDIDVPGSLGRGFRPRPPVGTAKKSMAHQSSSLGRVTGVSFAGGSANTANSAHGTNLGDLTGGKHRAARLGLYLRLSQLYLECYKVEEAIHVLEVVLESGLPRGKTPAVKMRLVQANMKLRYFSRVAEIINEMEQLSSESPNDTAAGPVQFTRGFLASYSDLLRSPEFLDIRATSLLHQGNYPTALYWTQAALEECPSSSLTYKARFHYLRGKMLRAVCRHKVFSLSSARLASSSHDISSLLPDVNDVIDSFSSAYEFYSKVNDPFRAAKVLSHIAGTFLDVLFVVVVILGYKLSSMASWMKRNGFDVSNELVALASSNSNEADASLCLALKRIEMPANGAMETFSQCLHPLRMMECILNFAELRLIQGLPQLSLAFWQESRDAFLSLFMNHTEFALLYHVTPAILEHVEDIFQRMVRLLLLFDSELIAKNLLVLDAFLVFQIEVEDLRLSLDPHDIGVSSIQRRADSISTSDENRNGMPNVMKLLPVPVGKRSQTVGSACDAVPKSYPEEITPFSRFVDTGSAMRVSSPPNRSHSNQTPAAISSPTRTQRFLKAGKKFTLGLRTHRLRKTNPSQAKGSGDEDLLLWEILDPKFRERSSSLIHVACIENDALDENLENDLIDECACSLSLIDRNCALFASRKEAQKVVYERNRHALRQICHCMSAIRALWSRHQREVSDNSCDEDDESVGSTNEDSLTSPDDSTVFVPSQRFSMSTLGASPVATADIAFSFDVTPSHTRHELWPNLFYFISIGSTAFMYSPVVKQTVLHYMPLRLRSADFIDHMLAELRSGQANHRSEAHATIPSSESNTPEPVMFAYRTQESLVPPPLEFCSIRELFGCLNPQNMMLLLTALFAERRILIFAKSQSRLISVIHSTVALMHPFTWQHMFVPLLSFDSLSLIKSNEPYLIGLRSSYKTFVSPPKDVVVVDTDTNHVFLPSSTVQMPSKLRSRLYKVMVRFQSSIFKLDAAKGLQEQTLPDSPPDEISTPFKIVSGDGEHPISSSPTPSRHQCPHVLSPSPVISTSDSEIGWKRSQDGQDLEPPQQSRSSLSFGESQYLARFGCQRGLVTLPVHCASGHEEHTLPLQTLREGFMNCFAKLLYRYRLFWDSKCPSSTFQVDMFLNSIKDSYRSFMTSLVQSVAFQAFLRERRRATPAQLQNCPFEGLVLDALASKWSELSAMEGISLVGNLYVSSGHAKMKKRWVVLRGNALSVFKSKRSQKNEKEHVDLVAGEFYVSSISHSSSLSSSSAARPGNSFDFVVQSGSQYLCFRSETYQFRKQWVLALQARSLTIDIKEKWLAALHDRQFHQRRRIRHDRRPDEALCPPTSSADIMQR